MRAGLGLLILVLLTACASPEVIGGSNDGGEPAAPITTAPDVGSVATTVPTSISDAAASLVCWSSPASGQGGGLLVEESGSEWGLVDPLTGMYGHAAAWGDIDDDGQPELVVGTFADREVDAYAVRGADGPRPDALLAGGRPMQDVAGWSEGLGRTSGAVFADLDGDSDADLLMIRHAGLSQQSDLPSQVFENVDGELRLAGTPLPAGFLGRTPAVADYDGDGLLDLYISEDQHGERGGVLLHNQGGFGFGDVTEGSGLAGVTALGVATTDLDGDGLPDLVLSERMFLNRGSLQFEEVTPEGFEWERLGADDDVAGVAVGDLDRDGLPDVVVGNHFRSAVEIDAEVPIRVFLNSGSGADGVPGWDELGEEAGLVAMPTLAPDVHIVDVDNDGWPDIATSASAADGAEPAIFRSLGTDPLTFQPPTELGSDQYWVGVPFADLDRDGLLDMFALEWEPALPSYLFMNRSPSGHWLEVSVDGAGQGVGATVRVFDSDGVLIGSDRIAVSDGYSSGVLPVAHVGLGDNDEVVVELELADGTVHTLEDAAVDSHLRWPAGCTG